jgi:predicted Zn-dependent protease with MMP-like domain
MSRSFGEAPSLDEIETIAREALDRLPEPFAGHLRRVVLRVEDFASGDLLDQLGIEDPFELTGLYSGRPAELESMTGDMPPMIHLFRRPILDEWAASAEFDEAGKLKNPGVTLEDLVVHVVIHEAGHHFGLSDDDMEWLEDELKKPT